MAELERESLAKLAELETEVGALKVEYADALEARRLVEEELAALKRQRQDSARRQSVLENKIIELECLTDTLTKGSSGILFSRSKYNRISTLTFLYLYIYIKYSIYFLTILFLTISHRCIYKMKNHIRTFVFCICTIFFKKKIDTKY